MRFSILCPGRGAYTKRSRQSLPAEDPWVGTAEELRAGYGLEPLLDLDRSKRWESARHLRADNVSPLIWLCTMLDAREAMREGRCVAVAGNSMGWYTALAVAGALPFEDGFRLVQEMALLQMEHEDGGQVVYPRVDEHWRPDPRLAGHIERALATSGGRAHPSIELGGYAVLAGTEEGVAHLLEALPVLEMGPTLYPFRLARHGPYHTPLVEDVRRRAQRQLADLAFRVPGTTLIDGRGRIHAPDTADPDELRAYTLGAQITTPFDFTTSVRVMLREFAPERIVLPGPGNTLGGITGQVLAAEGWHGIRTRGDFERAQESERPPVHSMRR